jgi:hypothetical protein
MHDIGLVSKVNLEVTYILKNLRRYDTFLIDLRFGDRPSEISVSNLLGYCINHFSEYSLPFIPGISVFLQNHLDCL